MDNNLETNHKYSVFALYRGTMLSIFVVVLIVLTLIFGVGFKDGLLSAPVTLIGTAIFIFFNILWDRSILANHLNFKLSKNSILFFQGDRQTAVNQEEIKKIEYFPDKNNIYDDDYINNFMSSGIRVITRTNQKFIIFSKVSGFNMVKRVLNGWKNDQ